MNLRIQNLIALGALLLAALMSDYAIAGIIRGLPVGLENNSTVATSTDALPGHEVKPEGLGNAVSDLQLPTVVPFSFAVIESHLLIMDENVELLRANFTIRIRDGFSQEIIKIPIFSNLG